MPAQIRPQHQAPRLALVYKNFSQQRGLSHIGLGVAALQNARALRTAGYIVEVWPISSATELAARLAADRELALHAHHVPVTHVAISALFLATSDLARLVYQYPDTEFAIISHSNIGFLQVDPNAFRLLREGAELEQNAANFHIGANAQKFQTWWTSTYQTRMLVFGNLYPFSSIRHKPAWHGGTLRIGCFCAIRPLKNILTAAAAALECGTRLRPDSLEFYISGGRPEGGVGVVAAIQQMYAGVPRAKLIQNHWQNWPEFLATVGAMDLLLQPSYTESFNMVTADGIARGVASVIGEAIDWAPRNWEASTDSASDMANKAIALLHDPNAVEEGVTALVKHNNEALANWKQFLALAP
jgi:hypothetical protein